MKSCMDMLFLVDAELLLKTLEKELFDPITLISNTLQHMTQVLRNQEQLLVNLQYSGDDIA
jgi:hypothetical protein